MALPTVSVPVPRVTLPPLPPPPLSAATVRLLLLRLRVVLAELANVTGEAKLGVSPPICSVPWLMVVAPV